MTATPSAERRSRKSSEKAARLAGASGRSSERAKTVDRYMPELLAKVHSGEMSLNAAYELTRATIARVLEQATMVGEEASLGPRSRINERRAALPKCPHCNGTGRLAQP